MIVIPAAGKSSRFRKEGIEVPKFMLPLGGKTAFDHMIESFQPHFGSEEFVIVASDDPEHRRFLEERMQAHNISNYDIVSITHSGQGMMSDVCQGLNNSRFSLDQPLLIHPADIARHGFAFPSDVSQTFTMDFEPKAEILPSPDQKIDVLRNAKGLGCYHFSNGQDFYDAYSQSQAPLVRKLFGEGAMEAVEAIGSYGRLVGSGYDTDFRVIESDNVLHLGTPQQYFSALRGNLEFPFGLNDAILNSHEPHAVALRGKVISAWLDSVVEHHGIDDGSLAYARIVLNYAEQIRTVTPRYLGIHLLNELSEACETQLALARSLEEIAYPEHDIQSLNYEHIDSLDNITAIFAFLSQPVTSEASQRFLDAHLAFPQNHAATENFHEFFWALADTDRTEFLSIILNVNQPELSFKMQMLSQGKGLLGKLLPPEKVGSVAKEYGSRFAQAIGGAVNNQDLAFLFSHGLKAVYEDAKSPRSDDPDIRFGYRITSFLIGIGGAKIAQAAHSFGQTPDAWGIGLGESKSQAAPMRRSAFINQAMALPEPWVSAIKRIGKARGTGTYIDTKIVEFDDGFLVDKPALAAQQRENGGLVLQLLKDGSARQSEHIFDLTIKTIKKIAAADAEAEQSIGGLIPVIEHKGQMIGEETDLRHAAAKAHLAEKLVGGVVISKPKLSIEFFTAGVFGHGEDFRFSRNIVGDHFNALPEITKQDLSVKREAAEGIFTAVLFTILSGKPFDHDRHGDNQGITCHYDNAGKLVIRIGDFDDGAIILDPPTENQKRLFANIIMDALANSAINGFNPISSLKHTFAKAQKTVELSGEANADDLSYVDAMVEAIIALGDYTKYMNAKATLRSVRAVFNADGIDPVIAATFSQRFADIRDLRCGNPAQTEIERRDKFYPRPTDETKKFTNPINRTMGRALLGFGSAVLSAASTSLLIGKSAINLPDGYQARFE